MSTVISAPVRDGAGVLAAVAELAPRFRERAPITERDRSIPRESMDDLLGSGMVAMFVPKALGGLELSVRDFVDATAAVAGGCPSTGWCAGQMAFAALVVAACPGEAAATVWADGPNVTTASTAQGLTATPAPGGFRLSGKGAFASGILHSEWLYLGAPVMREGAAPEHRYFLVPRADVDVLDTWQTAAMRGTGSNTVVLDAVFVREEFSVLNTDLREGTGAGSMELENPLYRLPWVTVVPLIYVSTMLGATQAAYAEAVAALRDKRGPGGVRSADSQDLQLQVSFVAAKIDAARMLLHALADRADSGEPYTLADRTKAVRDTSYLATQLTEAIDTVLAVSGTGGFAATGFVQQAWRDVHLCAAHQALNKSLFGNRFGRMELGVEDVEPPLFY